MDALLDSDPLTVSGYTLHSRLGEGAYGVVYAASHARFGRVALKVLRPTLANIPQVRARLRAEAQALQRSNSPNPHIFIVLSHAPETSTSPAGDTAMLVTLLP